MRRRKRWSVDVWRTPDDNEEGECVAYIYEDGKVEFINPEAKYNTVIREEIAQFIRDQRKRPKWESRRANTRGRAVNEMSNQSSGSTTEYIIKYCDCTFAEDSYIEGEGKSQTTEYMSSVKSDTLEGLMRKFNEVECYGHEFNIEDWVYDSDKPNRLELEVMGKLIRNGNVEFDEPSAKDWEEFKQDKCKLTSFVFDLYIEKHEITKNITDEFKRLGIRDMW